MNLVIIYLFIPIASLDDELIKNNNWCCYGKIDIFTDTEAILNWLDLASIMVRPGSTRAVFYARFLMQVYQIVLMPPGHPIILLKSN